MAELPIRREEPIEEHHLEFSCFSCKEHVDQLSCLPCLHSLGVCQRKECRQKLTERGAVCQHCRECFNEPAEGFPRYAFAERKAAAKKMEEEGAFCHAKHDLSQVAVVFCSNCPGLLCEECHNAHRTVAVLKEHRIVSLEDTMKAGLAVQGRPLLCPSHKEELKCFCQDCKVLICTACLVVGPHHSHSVQFVGEQNRQPLEQCIRFAEKRIKEMLSAVRDVDSYLLALREESNRCKEDIADLKEHMIEAVNHRCAVLVAEVEEAEEKRRRDIEQYKETLEAQKKQFELFQTSATEIIQESTTIEQFCLHQTVISRASSLTSTPLPTAPSFSYGVFLMTEGKEEAEKVLAQVGVISFGLAPEASSMEGLSIVDNTVECRPWNLPLNIRVVSRDSDGMKCSHRGERVESVLTPTGCGALVQGEVEDRGDGTYQVAFKRLPSEECRLSVTVNGSDIRGSPVRVRLDDYSIIKQEIKDCEKRHFLALVCTIEGTLLATDNTKGQVCSFAQSGELLSSFKVQNPGKYLSGLAVLSDGNIAVSVIERKCVAVYTPNGVRVKEFGLNRLKGPLGLAVNHRGQLFVADGDNHKVCVFTENGEFLSSFGSWGKGSGQFKCPNQICFNPDGLVYVSDSSNNRIQVFQQDGSFVRGFGQDVLNRPVGLALTKDGHIVVASREANKLFIFTQSGECVHEVKDIGLSKPRGIFAADDRSIFVADYENSRIVKL